MGTNRPGAIWARWWSAVLMVRLSRFNARTRPEVRSPRLPPANAKPNSVKRARSATAETLATALATLVPAAIAAAVSPPPALARHGSVLSPYKRTITTRILNGNGPQRAHRKLCNREHLSAAGLCIMLIGERSCADPIKTKRCLTPQRPCPRTRLRWAEKAVCIVEALPLVSLPLDGIILLFDKDGK
jgi:hypothetical protein